MPVNTEKEFVRKRRVAVFYSCGTCNLKCHYCGIDKNPILVKIDKALEESFEGDYYIEQLKPRPSRRRHQAKIAGTGNRLYSK